MSRVELSEGAWAELADPARLSIKRRRLIERAGAKAMTPEMVAVISSHQDLDPEQIGGKLMDAGFDLSDMMDGTFAASDAAVLAFVDSWSFGDVTDDVLGELPGVDYDQLQKVCEVLVTELHVDFSTSTDPARSSPTMPSGA